MWPPKSSPLRNITLQTVRSSIPNALRQLKQSRNTIPVLKGSLSYLLFFILFFLKPFQRLLPFPTTGTAAVLITIIGFPGWSVDASLIAVFSSMLGAAIGGFNFFILAKLAPYPVAQAVVFFPMVYILGLLKTKSPLHLVFALICVSMSWNGIYTSTSSPLRQFSPNLLKSFLESFAWGGAIVVFVNIFIFPHSSEAELRTTLVHSIDHIRTFAFLIKKTYWCTITEEEAKVRDNLVQLIRADFKILQVKLDRTFFGITYSKWSGDDYKKMIQITKSMQQSLISTHSNLNNITQSSGKIFIDQVMANGPVNDELLRKYVYVGLTEVQKELALGSESAPFVQKEMELLKEISIERLSRNRSPPSAKQPSPQARPEDLPSDRSPNAQEAATQLREMQDQIALEISAESPANLMNMTQSAQVNISIRQHWNNLQMLQNEVIGKIYQSGSVYHPQEPLLVNSINYPIKHEVLNDEPCNIDEKRDSDIITAALKRSSLLQPIFPPTDALSRRTSHERSTATKTSELTTDSSLNEYNDDELQRSLLRTFSHSFTMGKFLEDLIELREYVLCAQGDGNPPHLGFPPAADQRRTGSNQNSQSSSDSNLDEEMTMPEALETLKGKQYVPAKISLLERVLSVEKFLRSPNSICAFKVACAVTTLAVLYWCDSTRPFAQKYNLNSCIITIFVAITPTLGQSWLSFTLQISGQGMGLLYGMIALSIFKDVGGYHYNPYGIIVAMTLFAIPMNYVLYTNPQLFVMSLLAMNSAAGLVYPLYLNQNIPFDSPPLRMGKSLTSLAIAIGIVTFFQLFVLRNPARRTLRKAMAKLMKANTAYTVIFQAYVSSTIPIDPSHRPSPRAIQRVQKELMKREIQIQEDITALMPLMMFARVEPAFGRPFNAVEYLKIARANQLILDRNRDARIAIGTTPLPRRIMSEFVAKLAPYRRPTLARIKTSLYLCTSTLQSKFPLPETYNAAGNQEFGQEILHDALVLACRLATTPEGLYLSSINSGFAQLECIQESASSPLRSITFQTAWSSIPNALRQLKQSRNTIPVLKGQSASMTCFDTSCPARKGNVHLHANRLSHTRKQGIAPQSDLKKFTRKFCRIIIILAFLYSLLSQAFPALVTLPTTGTAAVLITIIGFPGWSVDASLIAVFSILGLLKTKSPMYLIFSLICVSMSWNGVYTSTSSPTRQFSPDLLKSFLQSFAWGGAIVVLVNMLIFPHSSEAELRTTLVHSIGHIRTFAYLIKKTYWCTITDEESKVRDNLVQLIRADFNILQAKLDRTFFGITYSKWSGDDYKKMIQITKSMQQSLISTQSNLNNITQSQAKIFIDQVMANGPVSDELLRKHVYVGLTEVQKELALGSESAPFVLKEMELLKDISIERLSRSQPPLSARQPSPQARPEDLPSDILNAQEAATQLRDMQDQIALEISAESPGSTHVPDQTFTIDLESYHPDVCSQSVSDFAPLAYQSTPANLVKITQSAQVNISIRQHWNNLQMLQNEVIGKIYQSGTVYHPQEPLLVDSIKYPITRDVLVDEHCHNDAKRNSDIITATLKRSSLLRPILSLPDALLRDTSHQLSSETKTPELRTNSSLNEHNDDELQRSLLRTFSHSFTMGKFLEDLIELREYVLCAQGDGNPRQKKLHTAFWLPLKARLGFLAAADQRQTESNKTPQSSHDSNLDKEMTMPEALETLKGIKYKYNLNACIITIFVAITPTLGQSWLSFTLQISGQGMGLLYGMIALSIFKDVGGYHYNPYGIIVAMTLFAIPMNYVLYTNPQLLVMSLLAMYSAAGLVYPLYLNQNIPFDSPPLRMGKSLTSLAIAIGIVTFFQLFVLRNPARRTLRKAMAKLLKANTAYTVILQAYVSSTIPIDPSHRPSATAIQRVHRNLMKREMQIQDDITALMPLMMFARVEPAFGRPFNTVEYLKIVRRVQANQLILDRNRDARIAIGTTPLPRSIMTEFTAKLAPYRRPTSARIKTSLYLCTSTLQSKFPLPETYNAAENQIFGQEILHDALVLACRLAATPEGLQLVKSKEITRYWLYLSSITGGFAQLECIQESAKKIFGRLEDETFNYHH
ncbi:hypothetical protein H4Q26_013814 [Puccinia striiformis f. sp. tritici PST-130]|nr:hypothetical protein H4Q26_013814 [Puccinia striiformis f. sp. tritici PST-130]